MASFMYYLPAVDQDTLIRDGRFIHQELQRWRLNDVFADIIEVPNHCVLAKVEAGPGGPGVVLTPHPANAAGSIPRIPGYNAESQTWWKIGKGDCEPWIGFQSDSPPGPEDLERREMVSGYRRPDNVGRSWLIPVARGRVSQYGHLPVDYEWSPESFEPGQVLRKNFEQLWKDSARVWDHLYVEGFNVDESFLAGFVARCFAINYRMGPRELEAFRRLGQVVFDRSDCTELASLTCDYPAILQFAREKKMTVYAAAADGTCSSRGDPAGSLNFDQAAASSE